MKMSWEEFKQFQWKYVLAMYFVQKVIWSSDVLHEQEISFMREHFPLELLRVLHLDEQEQLPQLLEEALANIEQNLSWDSKMDILGMSFAAAASTGTVTPNEIAVIQVAAETLKIPNEILFEYIQHLLDDSMMDASPTR